MAGILINKCPANIVIQQDQWERQGIKKKDTQQDGLYFSPPVFYVDIEVDRFFVLWYAAT